MKDEHPVEDPGADPVARAVREACRSVLDEHAGQVEAGGTFLPEERTLSVRVRSPGGEEFQDAVLEVFFDLFFFLDLDLSRPLRYEFQWSAGPRQWRLETDARLLPDTGGVTRDEWRAFTSQLLYTLDGQPQSLPAPDFLDEFPAQQ